MWTTFESYNFHGTPLFIQLAIFVQRRLCGFAIETFLLDGNKFMPSETDGINCDFWLGLAARRRNSNIDFSLMTFFCTVHCNSKCSVCWHFHFPCLFVFFEATSRISTAVEMKNETRVPFLGIQEDINLNF